MSRKVALSLSNVTWNNFSVFCPRLKESIRIMESLGKNIFLGLKSNIKHKGKGFWLDFISNRRARKFDPKDKQEWLIGC